VTTTTITAADCPIWCDLFTAGQHAQLHGAHMASFAGGTALTRAALLHRPGDAELTVEITVPGPSGTDRVTTMTVMAAVDLAQALTTLTAELARIGSGAPAARPQPRSATTGPGRHVAGTTPTGSPAPRTEGRCPGARA
jgi:hypothetical protein